MNESKEFMRELLTKVNSVLENEANEWRPANNVGAPGGLIVLRQDLPTLVVPDLHGRHDYLTDLIKYNFKGKSVFELLKLEQIQAVCVGDGMHSERRGLERWRIAYKEYMDDFKQCPAMAEEMTENFRTMAMVMKLKVEFPHLFHFLKGNHENILDENGNGNHPFAKFAAEGPMTERYVRKFYGNEFLEAYDRFEKNLPILARGKFFIISHSRPKQVYSIDEILNCRKHPEVIEGLTWTRYQAAETGAIPIMLNQIIGDVPETRYWFCGHTAIKTQYKYTADESLVEIHNPALRTLVIIEIFDSFNMKNHIVTLPEGKDTQVDKSDTKEEKVSSP